MCLEDPVRQVYQLHASAHFLHTETGTEAPRKIARQWFHVFLAPHTVASTLTIAISHSLNTLLYDVMFTL